MFSFIDIIDIFLESFNPVNEHCKTALYLIEIEIVNPMRNTNRLQSIVKLLSHLGYHFLWKMELLGR